MADDWKEVTMSDNWDFETNKELVGVYLGKEEHVGENDSTTYQVETKDHKIVSFWGSTVLDTRLKNIQPGEEIKVVYLGQQPSPNRKGKFYKNYQVFHRPSPMVQG